VEEEDVARFARLLEARVRRVPLQHLLGEVEFHVAAIEVELDPVAATRLLAKARGIADEEGFEADPRSEGRLVEPTKQTGRARLGKRFDAEWEAGAQMPLEETLALARDTK